MTTDFRKVSGDKRKWRVGKPLSDADYLEFLKERFWAQVDKTPGQGIGDCWEWQGSRDARGYGQAACRLLKKNRPSRAHRISYFLAHGYVPDQKQIRHTCDNPPCVNPDHLLSGTAKQNYLDSVARGRAANLPTDHSTKNFKRKIKLTKKQGKEITKRRKAKGINVYDMAFMLGIDFTGYYRAETGSQPFALEHYHFITRFLGLNEESLGIKPSQFYEMGTSGKERINKARPQPYIHVYREKTSRIHKFWSTLPPPDLSFYRADILRERLIATRKRQLDIRSEAKISSNKFYEVINGLCRKAEHVNRVAACAGISPNELFEKAIAA